MTATPEEMRAALTRHRGNKTAAASELGIHRTTFREALTRYGIEYDEPDKVLSEWCEEHDVPIDDVSGYWHKTDEMSVFVRRRNAGPDYLAMRDAICAEMDRHAPVYPRIEYTPKGENLLVLDPCDVHIGKLSVASETGVSYNSDIAARRMREGVSVLLAAANPHGIATIVIVLGNDILHVDTPHNVTTSGTRQDVSGMWHEAYDAAKAAYVQMIEAAAAVAPVHLVHCPSNHDFMSGYMLTDSIVSWFRQHPGVTAERRSVNMRHRKYIQFGANLLCFTHGDGARENDLHGIALKEARESFAQVRRVYWHCHHIHHKKRKIDGVQIEKDHPGATVMLSAAGIDRDDACIVEYIRSQSESDGWHDRNGYVGAVQAMEAFIYSPRSQIGRFTHEF